MYGQASCLRGPTGRLWKIGGKASTFLYWSSPTLLHPFISHKDDWLTRCCAPQGEGVAYRGRVLVQLSTQLEGKADKAVDDISSDHILVTQVHPQSPLLPRLRSLCGLFWCFHHVEGTEA
jgi:hypothetical protein